MSSPEVVIVGGGISGSALATALASAGRSVTVLERSTEYVDRVRGEYMHPWGVAEAQQLGVIDALERAGGVYLTRFVPYDECLTPDQAEAAAVPLAAMVPNVPGALSLRHPVACDALEQAAVEAGAEVVRSVADVVVSPGTAPEITYAVDGREHTAHPRLVVGADGRDSSVRRQLGINLGRSDARVVMGGLLVSDVDWPAGDGTIGTEDDRTFFIFPQSGRNARLYLALPLDLRARLSGQDKTAALLDAFRLKSVPGSERLAGATPAGPCAAYPMEDSWTDTVAVDGVVLMGDAAGFSDPMIGEGLSIAMRDARLVRDVLLGSNDWSPASFTPYVEERAERMRRLRECATVFTDVHIPLGPDGIAVRRRRLEMFGGADPEVFMLAAAMICGPEQAPPQCFEPPVRERLLGAA